MHFETLSNDCAEPRKHYQNWKQMKKSKIKLQDIRVKSFVTSSSTNKSKKLKGNDGGYTWVG